MTASLLTWQILRSNMMLIFGSFEKGSVSTLQEGSNPRDFSTGLLSFSKAKDSSHVVSCSIKSRGNV